MSFFLQKNLKGTFLFYFLPLRTLDKTERIIKLFTLTVTKKTLLLDKKELFRFWFVQFLNEFCLWNWLAGWDLWACPIYHTDQCLLFYAGTTAQGLL